MRTPQLRELWQELFAKPPHPKLRRDMMIPILAYQIQENVYGGLKASTRKRLQKLSEELDRSPQTELKLAPQIKAGTKLIRHWRGRRHEVLASDEGFDYRGKRYRRRSASVLRSEITHSGRPVSRRILRMAASWKLRGRSRRTSHRARRGCTTGGTTT